MALRIESLPDTLTEKEKETLRLLLRGHDAKSSACELDLSVHTINERLRSARRKLDVTSSREAARVLFESEGGTYENPGYETLGDAPKGGTPDQLAGGQFRPFVIGGILVMLSLAIFAAFALSDAPARERPIGDPATPAQLETYEAAARDWLAIVDAGNGERAYGAASDMFRAVIPRESWASQLTARMEYGPVRSRKVHRIDTVALDGRNYQIVRLHTDFDRRKDAIERVTLENEDGGWAVNNYEVD